MSLSSVSVLLNALRLRKFSVGDGSGSAGAAGAANVTGAANVAGTANVADTANAAGAANAANAVPVVLAAPLVSTSDNIDDVTATTITEENNMQTEVVGVQGMSCQHCVQAVTKAVSAIDGVTQVQVSLEDANASVSFDPAKTNLEAIKTAIADEGFQV
jgi:copper ion binding protein